MLNSNDTLRIKQNNCCDSDDAYRLVAVTYDVLDSLFSCNDYSINKFYSNI